MAAENTFKYEKPTWSVCVIRTKPDGSTYVQDPYELATENGAYMLTQALRSAGFKVKVIKNETAILQEMRNGK